MDKENKITNEIEEEQELSKKEYVKLKARLETIRGKGKGKYYWWGGLLSTIVFSSIFISMTYDRFYGISVANIWVCISLAVILSTVVIAYMAMMFEAKEASIKRRILEYEAENIKDEVKEDIFENSIKMSYKYLDQYYLQTREQAQKGFFITACVAIFGAVLIGIGIVAMFLNRVEPTYITCGAGVITEFIAAIFFYLYNKTVTSMSKYHNKLVLSQNISIALKVSDSLPSDDKIKAKNMIISELLKDVNSYLIRSDSNDKGTEENK